MTVEDGVIVALEDDPGADVRDRRRAAARSSPASSTATRTCRSPAGARGVRAEGHRRAVRGDRAPRRRDRAPRRARSPRRATTRCSRRRAAMRAEMLAHGTTTFEAKTGYGLSREGELRRGPAGPRARRRPPSPACSPTRSRPATTPPAGWTRSTRWPPRRTSTRSTSTSSRSPSATRTSSGSARSRAREGVPLRAHVEQFNANRSVPVALAAGARSVDHLACLHPDDLAPLAAAECAAVLLPGAEFLGAEETAPGPRAGRRGRDLRAGHRLQPGHLAGRLAAAGHRARRAPLRLDGARGAGRRARSTPRGCSGCDDRGSIEVGKRADLARARRARSSTSPTASAATRSRAVIAGGRGRVAMIAAEHLEELLADLVPIGLDEDGGTTRLAWTREDEEAAGWFARRAAAIGRTMERDPAGNLWAVPGRARRRGGRPARTSTACAPAGASTARSASPPAFAVAERRCRSP